MKIGILGGGQLAKMLVLAGYPLGIQIVCIDPNADCCAQPLCPVVHTEFDNIERIHEHFKGVSCVTYETENLPLHAVEKLQEHYTLYPSLEALRITQDRLFEKNFLHSLNIPTAEYHSIDSLQSLDSTAKQLGFPLILKTRRNGYDGKGQVWIKSESDLLPAWKAVSTNDLIIEKIVPFEAEISLIFARNPQGDMVFYPLTLNHHEQGILRLSEAPYDKPELELLAQNNARAIAERLQYVGVMAIEFFYANHQLIVNELAPRVHNSGHWTIEGAVTSQFENHLRAILGLPLGSTTITGYSKMINCIGEEPKDLRTLLSIPHLHFHSYGKSPRAHRKLGHMTICATNQLDTQSSFVNAKHVMDNIDIFD